MTRVLPWSRFLSPYLLSCALVGALALPAGLLAQVAPPEGSDPLSKLAFASERIAPPDDTALVASAGQGALAGGEQLLGWDALKADIGGTWTGYVDHRTGRLEYAEGSGLPWIPGRGNSLSAADVGPVNMAALEKRARAFLAKNGALLGVDPASLVLNHGRSGQLADHLWMVDFDLVVAGLPVEGARVTFSVGNGNLIAFGTEGLPAPKSAAPSAALTREQALASLARYVSGFSSADTFGDSGSLHLITVAPGTDRSSLTFEKGKGRQLAAVWDFTFHRDGSNATWRGRVDAGTGTVLAFEDTNRYAGAARINGGVYVDPIVFTGEQVRPSPFADYLTSTWADTAGRYTYPGGTVTSKLHGKYATIADSCGAISLSAGTPGNLSFGTSGGTNCTTPGVGGAGNTHSARTQFYQINRAKEMARGWLPTNTWLNGNLTANVNLLMTCNAYWNGLTLNFFRSGGGCANTGELAGVSLHEWGHGLDQNDGNGSSADGGTGEAYGDFSSAILYHDSCMGPGFFIPAANCGGYGDPCTSCSGVRDIDFAHHVSGLPATPDGFIRTHCPAGTGACGREVHCESYVTSEALWDLAARDLPGAGTATAWSVTERLWFLTRPTATRGFSCTTTSIPWVSNGCVTGSYFRTMRVVDDDDGNLANGTPHGTAIFNAFNRHLMACATDPAANTTFAACTPPASTTVTLVPMGDQIQLSWTSSGAGVTYDVYRNELGCNVGYTRIASAVTATTYTDTQVTNPYTYYYRVIPHHTGNEACAAAPSACVSTVPLVKTDVWSKDLPADTGLEPEPSLAGSPMWTSDDIWVRTTNTVGPHQNPEFGQPNYVHVMVRNRSTVTATGTQVNLYYANASVGLAWPVDWHLIGTTTVASLAGGASTDVTIVWSPPGTGHYCLLSRLITNQDPLTFAETTSIDYNVRNNNNLVWKNVNVVNLVPFVGPMVVRFNFRNPDDIARVSRLRFREEKAKPGFLTRGTVVIDLGDELAKIWKQQGQTGANIKILDDRTIQIADPANAYLDVQLDGRQEFDPTMAMQDNGNTVPTQQGTGNAVAGDDPIPLTYDFGFEIVQEDAVKGNELGGIRYAIQIDQSTKSKTPAKK